MLAAERSCTGSHSKAFATMPIGVLHKNSQALPSSSLLASQNRRRNAPLSSGTIAINNNNIIHLQVGRLSLSLRLAGRNFFVSSATILTPGTRGEFPKFKTDVWEAEVFLLMPATLFFLRQPPAPRRLGNIGPSPAFWQVKSTQCLFRASQQPPRAMRARHKQHKDQSTRFLARENSLSVKSRSTIRRRQNNTKTNQLSFWRGEFFGRQGSNNDPTAAMVMINNPSNKHFTAIIVRL
jgi:hypothetical protein